MISKTAEETPAVLDQDRAILDSIVAACAAQKLSLRDWSKLITSEAQQLYGTRMRSVENDEFTQQCHTYVEPSLPHP